MRKSKRKELQSKTRGALYGNMTPRERSVSPMFTGLQVRKFPAIDFSLAGQAKRQEESKGRSPEAAPI